MRGLSMVNSYSIIFMGWCYVRYGLPKSWLFFILLANVVISLILAAHIDSLRGTLHRAGRGRTCPERAP